MLPVTARPNDIVEVINEDHEYYGMLGKLVRKAGDKVTVEFYKKQVVLGRAELSMKARVGTSKHQELNGTLGANEAVNLTREDYNELIAIAEDSNDYSWVVDLKRRRDGG